MKKNNKKILILGAGISGLAAGWQLSEKGFKVVILDSSNQIGGLSTSFEHNGFLLDYGPHKIYTQLDEVLEEIKNLLGQDLCAHKKRSSVYLENRFFSYPFKMSELICGLRFGVALQCFGGFLATFLKKVGRRKEIITYEDYVIDRFGRPLYNLVFKPLANKIWGEPRKISYILAEKRIPIPNMAQLIMNTLIKKDSNSPQIDAKVFYYPAQGIRQLVEAMQKRIMQNGGKILLNSRIRAINLDRRELKSLIFEQQGQERQEDFGFLISTIPIGEAIRLITPKFNGKILAAAEKLKFRSVLLVYIVLNKNRVIDDHWIFFPEEKFLFNRLFEQKSFSENMSPKDKTVLCLDLTYEKNGPMDTMDEKVFCEKVIQQLEDIGLIERKDVLEYFTYRRENVYPMYDLEYQNNLQILLDAEATMDNFFLLGRLGLFNYNNMDHCIDMGLKMARFLNGGSTKEEWARFRKGFEKYQIVD